MSDEPGGLKKCPYCAEEIPEASRVCKFCSTPLVKKCPSCAEEINALARKCRFCGSELGAAASPAGGPKLRRDVPLGERRDILMTVVLTFLTCGVYFLIVLYKVGDELDRHRGRNDINAGLDILLLFLTCGFWSYYLMYKYPRALEETLAEEGVTKPDLVLPCLLLAIFGLHIVSLMILQHELNRHWEAHGAPA